MCKRILSILGACLVLASVLALFVVPASAQEEPRDRVWYTPLIIDYFVDGSGKVVPIPASSGLPDTGQTFDDWYGCSGGIAFTSGVGLSGPTYTASFHGALDDGITFYTYDTQYIRSNLRDFAFYTGSSEEDLTIDRVSVSFQLYEPIIRTRSDGQQYWELTFHTVDFEVSSSNGWYEIGDVMETEIQAIAPGYTYYLIDQLVIDVQWTRNSYAVPSFGLSSGTTANRSDDFALQWMYERNFHCDVGSIDDVDIFGWLLSSVDAFLNFELAPGVTFNRVILVSLAIGVLMWFIRFLM